ncbi:hypothetical protein QAD02_002427 [Eretmocerus hayati]|uniref:Uncharacterized protein n=1 Tax=Eretmocerus hayati TaxID=131215 RepID=A0ACC2NJ02_9HYME|nr:hypothetical protein QAD02_002427 [Eretmocerus hayati]
MSTVCLHNFLLRENANIDVDRHRYGDDADDDSEDSGDDTSDDGVSTGESMSTETTNHTSDFAETSENDSESDSHEASTEEVNEVDVVESDDDSGGSAHGSEASYAHQPHDIGEPNFMASSDELENPESSASDVSSDPSSGRQSDETTSSGSCASDDSSSDDDGGIMANRGADWIRCTLTDYFVSREGNVRWQWNYI